MSILWKMAVFIEKSPVTSSSSSCYETIKTASTVYKRFEPQPDLVRRCQCQPFSDAWLI
jgi:hypothetical protein